MDARLEHAEEAAQLGQVGEGEQGAGDRVGDRQPRPIGQPTPSGGRQQVGQLLALGVSGRLQGGERVVGGAHPPGAAGLPGGLVGGVGLAGTCVLNGQAQDDDADDANDGGIYRGSYDAATKKVTAIIPTLAGGASLNAAFRVTIN